MLLVATASRFQSENHIMGRVVKRHHTACCYRTTATGIIAAVEEAVREILGGFGETFEFIDY